MPCQYFSDSAVWVNCSAAVMDDEQTGLLLLAAVPREGVLCCRTQGFVGRPCFLNYWFVWLSMVNSDCFCVNELVEMTMQIFTVFVFIHAGFNILSHIFLPQISINPLTSLNIYFSSLIREHFVKSHTHFRQNTCFTFPFRRQYDELFSTNFKKRIKTN